MSFVFQTNKMISNSLFCAIASKWSANCLIVAQIFIRTCLQTNIILCFHLISVSNSRFRLPVEVALNGYFEDENQMNDFYRRTVCFFVYSYNCIVLILIEFDVVGFKSITLSILILCLFVSFYFFKTKQNKTNNKNDNNNNNDQTKYKKYNKKTKKNNKTLLGWFGCLWSLYRMRFKGSSRTIWLSWISTTICRSHHCIEIIRFVIDYFFFFSWYFAHLFLGRSSPILVLLHIAEYYIDEQFSLSLPVMWSQVILLLLGLFF